MGTHRIKGLLFAATLLLMLAMPAIAFAAGLDEAQAILTVAPSPVVTDDSGANIAGEQVPPGTLVDTEQTQSPGSGLPAGTPPPGSAAAKPILIGLMVVLVAAVVLLGVSLMKKGGKK